MTVRWLILSAEIHEIAATGDGDCEAFLTAQIENAGHLIKSEEKRVMKPHNDDLIKRETMLAIAMLLESTEELCNTEHLVLKAA